MILKTEIRDAVLLSLRLLGTATAIWLEFSLNAIDVLEGRRGDVAEEAQLRYADFLYN